MRNVCNAMAAAALLLAACSGDVKDTKITAELLEDPAATKRVANRLEPAERQLFGRYLMNRSLSGTEAGGLVVPITNADGKDPVTVGEAIQLVRQREARNAKRDALRQQCDTQVEALRATHKELQDLAEKARWAPPQTDAANAMIPQIEAAQRDCDAKVEAVR